MIVDLVFSGIFGQDQCSFITSILWFVGVVSWVERLPLASEALIGAVAPTGWSV